MRSQHFSRVVAVAAAAAMLWVAASIPAAKAQQVTISTPFRTLGDHYFENNSISWGGNYRGMSFSVNGGNLSAPQFGNYNPSAGLRTNFGISGPNGYVNFFTNFGQGYTQSAVSQTPSVTIMNGQTGYVSDTSQTPFVMSLIPVLNSMPPPMMPPQTFGPPQGGAMMVPDPRVQALLQAREEAAAQAKADAALGQQPAPAAARQVNPQAAPMPAAEPDFGERLNRAQDSAAGRAAPSVAEARRLRAQEKGSNDQELLATLDRARALEEDGKPGVAKIYYQQIVRHGSGAVKTQAQERLDALQGSSGR